MARTLRYGSRTTDTIAARITKHVVRRHTPAGYDRCMELAAQDFARHVALEVSPKLNRPYVHYVPSAPGFGQRDKAPPLTLEQRRQLALRNG